MAHTQKFEAIKDRWAPLLESDAMPAIKDSHRRNVTALMLEVADSTASIAALEGQGVRLLSEDPIPANFMGASSSTAGSGGVDVFDPVLITMVRRLVPNLIAYDLIGVQPMSGPTGLIFALRPTYSTQGGNESWYNEVVTSHSSRVGNTDVLGDEHTGYLPGNNSVSANLAGEGVYNVGNPVATAQGEAFGTTGNVAWPEMAFTIDKSQVEAKTRALKAEYTIEIAQDLKAIHGLDVEAELSHILSTELLAEVNRWVMRTVNLTAKRGSVEGTTTPGYFDLDTDSNGRWLVEKFKGLIFQIEKEANRIAKETRRGKGNWLVTSSDVASALHLSGLLDYTPALENSLQVDDTGNTFAGILLGKYKVYIDPYADSLLNGTPGLNYFTVGYKGSHAYDAGMFYCPYVPLQAVRAVDPNSFQPKLGFKHRAGLVANPFAQGATTTNQGQLIKDSNVFFRRSLVKNLI